MRESSCHRLFRTAALCAAVFLFLLSSSCRKKENDMIPNFADRSKVPGMWLDSVTTLISDSGIIRYRVVTAKWDAFDKTEDPYWFFPEKVYFERFNDTLVIESTVESDTAWYYYDRKMWVLRQNVKVRNLSGETFETTLLNWDQNTHQVYSDTAFIRIRQREQVITGHGFKSNESMTNYTIDRIEGMFPVDRDTAAVSDTSLIDVPIRDDTPIKASANTTVTPSDVASDRSFPAPVHRHQKKVVLPKMEAKDI